MTPTLPDGTPNLNYNPSCGMAKPRTALECLEEEAVTAVQQEHTDIEWQRARRPMQAWTGGRLQPNVDFDPFGGADADTSENSPDARAEEVEEGDEKSSAQEPGPALSHAGRIAAQNLSVNAGRSDQGIGDASEAASAADNMVDAIPSKVNPGGVAWGENDGLMTWGRGQPTRAHVNLIGAGLSRVYAPEALRAGGDESGDEELEGSLAAGGEANTSHL